MRGRSSTSGGGEAELAEQGVTVRCLTRADGGLPAEVDEPDLVATVATVTFALAFLVRPEALSTAVIGATATACQLVRWSRWQFYRTLGDPMVWILHLGFLWLAIGLGLLSLGSAGLLPLSSGIHALMTGAASTMILAVASRAALGHSNRPLDNHPLLTASYVGISLSALLRIIASLSASPLWMALATTAWVVSLCLFAWRYTPILLGPPPRTMILRLSVTDTRSAAL